MSKTSMPGLLRRHPLLSGLVALLMIQIPFAFLMPFHIDDLFFLTVARQIQSMPLAPLSAPLIFEGQIYPDMMSMSHPPLACYYLSVLQFLGGAHPEILVHLGWLGFFFLLASGLYGLCLFCGRSPVYGMLLGVLSPAVLVSSHTVMMDLPTLALGTVGVVLALYGFRRDRLLLIGAGGLVVGLAALVSYGALFYLLPPLVYAIVRRKSLLKMAVLVLPPALLLTAWMVLLLGAAGRFVWRDLMDLVLRYRSRPKGELDSRIVYNLCSLGMGLLPAAVFLALPFLARRFSARFWLYPLFSIPLWFWLRTRYPEDGTWHWCVMAVTMAGAGALLVEAILSAVRRMKEYTEEGPACGWMLAAWLGILVPLTVISYPHGAVRYQLAYLPPLVVLALMAGQDLFRAGRQGVAEWAESRGRVVLGMIILLQGAIGLALSLGDLDLARGYRQVVSEVCGRHGKEGRTVWIASDWELRHYVLEAGGRTILRYDARPMPGDVILQPLRNGTTYEMAYHEAPWGTLAEDLPVPAAWPIRVMSHEVRAGFYSDYWGFLPGWPARGSVPLDVIRVFRVLRPLPPDEQRARRENVGPIPVRDLRVIPR